jgi:predicted HicB family RNase H-like nuclease
MKVAGGFEYKGFVGGDLALDAQTGFIDGRIVNARTVITFAGRGPSDIERAFRRSVDEYLAVCAEENVAPEKPFSGQLNIRIGPDLHRAVTLAAERRGASVNAFVAELLESSTTEKSS